ncbi:hypothetical protein CAPTEDRAFT_197933 [Capitella teleta]|uniref:Protein DP71L n=1 Tax=Capitella teleta TaxID=283909 RepID=R7U6B5_CAPTE|nr:hypothetical protein CAPTEDRAFT_197933 [Capitella teleta]|eukprot:ELU01514.1 hypothetical protein CAPTEDRAFT_197933 [Capitella teleta]
MESPISPTKPHFIRLDSTGESPDFEDSLITPSQKINCKPSQEFCSPMQKVQPMFRPCVNIFSFDQYYKTNPEFLSNFQYKVPRQQSGTWFYPSRSEIRMDDFNLFKKTSQPLNPNATPFFPRNYHQNEAGESKPDMDVKALVEDVSTATRNAKIDCEDGSAVELDGCPHGSACDSTADQSIVFEERPSTCDDSVLVNGATVCDSSADQSILFEEPPTNFEAEDSFDMDFVDGQDDSILFEDCAHRKRTESTDSDNSSIVWSEGSDNEVSQSSASSTPNSTPTSAHQMSFTFSPRMESSPSPFSLLVECKSHKRGKKSAEVSVQFLDQSSSDVEFGSPAGHMSFFVKPETPEQGSPLTVHVSPSKANAPDKKLAMNVLIQNEDDEAESEDESEWDEADDDGDFSWDKQGPICGLISDSTNQFGFQFTILPDGVSDSEAAEAFEDPFPKSETVIEANRKWSQVYNDSLPAKEHTPSSISFAKGDLLFAVTVDSADPKLCQAYAEARKGEWEMFARDRSRFASRVQSLEKIISPILSEEHRQHIRQSMEVHS